MSAKPLVVILVLVVGLIGFLFFKMQTLEKAQALAQQSAYLNQAGVQSPTSKVPTVTVSDHVRGNTNAKITVVEYSDFECPSCQQFQPTVKQIMQTYGNNIRWVVRNYPLPQHVNAEKEAEASECAAEIGGNSVYWKYSDTIYQRSYSGGTGYSLNNLVPLAQELGLNKVKFQDCLNSGKFAGLIQRQTSDANVAGAYQLPATFILDSKGSTKLVGSNQPFVVYKTIIDMDLQNI